MTIVAAVDRTERASAVVREADRLARAFGEPVHAVHVLTRSEFVGLERTSVDDTGAAVHPDRVREIAAEIAAETTADLDVPVEAVGLMGDPADRIVEYAADTDARYIVSAARKRSPTGKAVFGSVTQGILLNADCPVVTTTH